jgi:hypothetical protein
VKEIEVATSITENSIPQEPQQEAPETQDYRDLTKGSEFAIDMAEYHVEGLKKETAKAWSKLIKEIQAIQDRVDGDSAVYDCLQAAISCCADREWLIWGKDHPED